MKFVGIVTFLATLQSSLAAPAFVRDVVRPSQHVRRQQEEKSQLNNMLLSRAIPRSEYEAQIKAAGGSVPERKLEDKNDDFYQFDDDATIYSFNGYSLKYAMCQPVQYFSEEAINAGEHSPMLTQDIVILRLCPYDTCKDYTDFGCQYNYAEYAISLQDYLTVMLKFGSIKRDNVCAWCLDCMGGEDEEEAGRRLEEAEQAEEGDEEEENGDEAENDGDEEQEQNEGEGEQQEEEEANDEEEEEAAADDDGGVYAEDYSQAYGCEDFYTYCSDYADYCSQAQNEEGNAYMDYLDYMEYLDCAQVDYNGYAYFVRPRCDGTDGSISMKVHYDNYCVQGADGVNIRTLGLGFREGFFTEFYTGSCITCSDTNYPPYFATGNTFCNNIHQSAATCSENLNYDLFDGEDDEDSTCSYIESIQFGTYDQGGELVSSATATGNWITEVTKYQKAFLAISIGICVFFIVYACYLHHAMTNLLIKSLSHRELLPPSRHNRRLRSPKSAASVASRRDNDEPDWHKPV